MSDKRNRRMRRGTGYWAVLGLGAVVALGWAAPLRAYEGGPVANGGSISGTVKFKGTPPAPAKLDVNKDTEVCGKTPKVDKSLTVASDGGIQYAVVSIPSITKGKPFSDAKVVLDQNGCEYVPHIVLAPPGAQVDIQNSDGILHNIHTYSQKNEPVNIAQPKFKKTVNATFKTPEAVRMACDVHGWMQGWMIVQNNPYYVVTDDKGAFKLTDIPPGEYEVQVWQEKLGESTQKVTVKPGADTTVNFELAPK